MSTVIRAEISENNPYWIGKHRYYELKHFCLQYKEWKKEYEVLCSIYCPSIRNSITGRVSHEISDPVNRLAMQRVLLKRNIELIERTAMRTDPALSKYILKGVTEEVGFTYLSMVEDIPCSKDTYYDRYHKFFWLLSKER